MSQDAPTPTESGLEPPAERLIRRRRANRGASARPTSSQWEPMGKPVSRSLLRGLTMAALAAIVVGALLWLAYERHVEPRTGTVAAIDGSRLLIHDGGSAPWTEASVDRLVRQGAELTSTTIGKDGGTALLRFPDGAQVRLDNEGSWEIVTLLASRNGRISELTVRQAHGQITAAAPPIRRLDIHHLYFQVPGHSIELCGVATLTTDVEGITMLTVHQGEAHVYSDDETIILAEGHVARLWPGALPQLLTPEP